MNCEILPIFELESKMTVKMTTELTTKVTVTPQKVNSCKDDLEKKELLSNGFREIAPFVGEKDIADAVIRFDSSNSTIVRHLKGNIGKLFFATELFKFMFGKASKREDFPLAA